MEWLQSIADKFNYWVYIVAMMLGLYAMISKNNLIKKLIGMSIFQTAIILFYVSIGYKDEATIPILYHDQAHAGHHEEAAHDPGHESDTHAVEEKVNDHANDSHAVEEEAHAALDSHADTKDQEGSHGSLQINPDQFDNPLPHVLMLTAIVVGVATLGVGLAITQKLYGEFGSIEENEIIEQIRSSK